VADQATEGLLSPALQTARVLAARSYLKGAVLDVGCGSGALAKLVAASPYVGVDVDSDVLDIARKAYPAHRFERDLPDRSSKFDTVVSLAVIEHVHEPATLLHEMSGRLRCHPDARLVLSTPHPRAEWIHGLGAKAGLFSKAASEEHETLFDEAALRRLGKNAGLDLVMYRRFLFGVNQLAVFSKAPSR
jgi:2-polyprenyl-3-methyl-5-hydroxy-6-metoxy-1,4-benzoquinol methylase